MQVNTITTSPAVRARACLLCGAEPGELCQPKPAGDHLARYLDAATAGQLTRAYMAKVLGELVVIDVYAVITVPAQPTAARGGGRLPMTALNAAARAAIRDAGFTRAEWLRMWGYADTTWGGDRCGCFDDRCIGHHHEGAEGCGCLETMISDAVAWRTATRNPNAVELVGGPYGLFQYVNVSAPGVLAAVSTSAGGVGMPVNGVARTRPGESVVRIEPREGWTAEVTEENGRIEIRLVKAPAGGDL